MIFYHNQMKLLRAGHPVNINRSRREEIRWKGHAARAVFKKRREPRRTMCALLNADREGKRSAAILLCIADRAENRGVEAQMFGEIQSDSSHWIEHLMNDTAAAA